MKVCQCLKYLFHNDLGIVLLQLLVRLSPEILQQGVIFHQLHDYVDRFGRVDGLVVLDNIGVTDLLHHLDLALNVAHVGRVRDTRLVVYFHSKDATLPAFHHPDCGIRALANHPAYLVRTHELRCLVQDVLF